MLPPSQHDDDRDHDGADDDDDEKSQCPMAQMMGNDSMMMIRININAVIRGLMIRIIINAVRSDGQHLNIRIRLPRTIASLSTECSLWDVEKSEHPRLCEKYN